MANIPRINFTYPKVLLPTTFHVSVTEEYMDIIQWLDARSHQSFPEINLVRDAVDLFATHSDGATYLACEHITRFCNLVVKVVGQPDDDAHPNAGLLRRLRDMSGRDRLTGTEIRALRRRQARSE